MQACARFDSPVGPLWLASEGEALVRLAFGVPSPGPEMEHDRPSAVLAEAGAQLAAYFAGRLRRFDLPVCPHGTPFQREVWTALQAIPFGETVSYGSLARRLGRPDAVRAVGLANGANPIAIVIPCHRVIGSSGALIGFGGGLATKRTLLALEQGQRTLEL